MRLQAQDAIAAKEELQKRLEEVTRRHQEEVSQLRVQLDTSQKEAGDLRASLLTQLQQKESSLCFPILHNPHAIICPHRVKQLFPSLFDAILSLSL
jgi:hypothetical protein